MENFQNGLEIAKELLAQGQACCHPFCTDRNYAPEALHSNSSFFQIAGG